MEALRIGQLMDALLERLRRRGRRIAEALLLMVERGDLEPLRLFAFRGHWVSSMTGWTAQSLVLPVPTMPPTELQAALAEAADEWARLVVSRVASVMGAGEPPISPRLYVDVIADIAVRRGWHVGASAAAEEAGARSKTWVRVYPVRHPRDWHSALEGVTIPAGERFVLPGGPNAGRAVEGPHDWDSLPDPREWVNCGHAVVYS